MLDSSKNSPPAEGMRRRIGPQQRMMVQKPTTAGKQIMPSDVKPSCKYHAKRAPTTGAIGSSTQYTMTNLKNKMKKTRFSNFEIGF